MKLLCKICSTKKTTTKFAPVKSITQDKLPLYERYAYTKIMAALAAASRYPGLNSILFYLWPKIKKKPPNYNTPYIRVNTVSINLKALLTKELRIVVKPLSFEATCVERSLGIMGYLSSPPYLAKWRLFCRSRLQCMRVFNESIQISQFRPPPYTFINLHTPPLTLNYPYSRSFSFICLHTPSPTDIHPQTPT